MQFLWSILSPSPLAEGKSKINFFFVFRSIFFFFIIFFFPLLWKSFSGKNLHIGRDECEGKKGK